MNDHLLKVENLSVAFENERIQIPAVSNVTFALKEKSILGIVGESGSGKTITSLSILNLLPQPSGKITSGAVTFNGVNLLSAPLDDLQKIRGKEIAMIFQEPMSALNPVRTVQSQLLETFYLHADATSVPSQGNVLRKLQKDLQRVGLTDTQRVLSSYPHELSGGMLQRVMIAMALMHSPRLLIADEPTTALDVTIQRQILTLLKSLHDETGMSIILITHDLGVVAELCDDVVVMNQGKVVETQPTLNLFHTPQEPYTKKLLKLMPRFADHAQIDGNHLQEREVLKLTNVSKIYQQKFRAVSDVNLVLHQGETLGIVGESGCGKSTLARMIVSLSASTSGTVTFEEQQKAIKPQMIFQDPSGSLNSRMKIKKVLTEPLAIHKVGNAKTRLAKITELLNLVGMTDNTSAETRKKSEQQTLEKYPHEFSGGQKQRIAIARALALDPSILVCDEAVSALDVSIQAQVLDLLCSLQKMRGLSIIFISHNLIVVKRMSHRMVVMYLGKVVEYGPSEELFLYPKHPYTQALIAATPHADPEQKNTLKLVLNGEPGSQAHLPSGCAFHPRCLYATERCKTDTPTLQAPTDKPHHFVACHFPLS